jgi:hypothetical protein
MSWDQLRGWSWKFILVPSLMGIFFGLGHFLSYFFFSYDGFKKL